MQSHEQFIRLMNDEKMFHLSMMERDMNRAINTIKWKDYLRLMLPDGEMPCISIISF